MLRWVLLLLLASWVVAAPVAPQVPEAAQASAHFDAKTATDAWLATISPKEKANSDAYFEGECWLILWGFLYTVGVMLLLLETKLSAKLRDWTKRGFLYWIAFVIVSYALLFPLTVYQGFFREHSYGLSNLSFGGWFSEEMIALATSAVLGGLAFCGWRR